MIDVFWAYVPIWEKDWTEGNAHGRAVTLDG